MKMWNHFYSQSDFLYIKLSILGKQSLNAQLYADVYTKKEKSILGRGNNKYRGMQVYDEFKDKAKNAECH